MLSQIDHNTLEHLIVKLSAITTNGHDDEWYDADISSSEYVDLGFLPTVATLYQEIKTTDAQLRGLWPRQATHSTEELRRQTQTLPSHLYGMVYNHGEYYLIGSTTKGSPRRTVPTTITRFLCFVIERIIDVRETNNDANAPMSAWDAKDMPMDIPHAKAPFSPPNSPAHVLT